MGFPVNVLRELVCPGCNRSLAVDQASSGGRLTCETCKRQFAVSPTLISFVTDLKEQDVTASGFGYEWNRFVKGAFDNDDIFGLKFAETQQYFLSRVGLNREDLKGMKILDAGTGSARIPKSLQGTGSYVYAVDIHKALAMVAEQCKNLPNASFFRADLFHTPFKDEFFDVAWSSGVIHHTPDPAGAFARIARKVKPGGRMFVSVYGRDLHHYRLLRRLMPFARRCPVAVTYLISVIAALPVYLAFNTALLLVRLRYRNQPPPYRLFGFTIENNHYQSYRSILLNMFDQLHPHYQSEHSINEVEGWFRANGFGDTAVVESIGMVGIRGVKAMKQAETPAVQSASVAHPN